MARITPSQLKSKLQQSQNKINQAVRNYNSAVDKYNRDRRAAVNKVNQLVNQYNQAVRVHNAQVSRNRSIISNELRRLQSSAPSSTSTQYRITYRTSSLKLNTSYSNAVNIGDQLSSLTPQQERIYDLIEQEHENNLVTANVVLENAEPTSFSEEDYAIGSMLSTISQDLDARWKGAVFSLNPANPDATRHFCTSAREIFTEAIEITAPDRAVFAFNPNCEKTDRGNATRRAKISYLLRKKDIDTSAEQFVDDDITNILDLFHVLSDGTHGAAGKYSIAKLRTIKKRVEGGIGFLCSIAL